MLLITPYAFIVLFFHRLSEEYHATPLSYDIWHIEESYCFRRFIFTPFLSYRQEEKLRYYFHMPFLPLPACSSISFP